MKRVSPEEKEKLLDQFLLFHKYARNHTCKYFICGGTFLGAIREKGFIDWDYDIDIAITDDQISNIWSIFSDLKKHDIKIHLDFYFTDGILKFGNDDCIIDIFIMTKKGNKWISSNKLTRKRWPNWYHYDNELFPLKLYDFEGYKVWGPRTDSILKRHYGNYMTPVYHESLNDLDPKSETYLKRKIIPIKEDGTLDLENVLISY